MEKSDKDNDFFGLQELSAEVEKEQKAKEAFTTSKLSQGEPIVPDTELIIEEKKRFTHNYPRGMVRFDDENRPQVHGQFEEEQKQFSDKLSENTDDDAFVDERAAMKPADERMQLRHHLKQAQRRSFRAERLVNEVADPRNRKQFRPMNNQPNDLGTGERHRGNMQNNFRFETSDTDRNLDHERLRYKRRKKRRERFDQLNIPEDNRTEMDFIDQQYFGATESTFLSSAGDTNDYHKNSSNRNSDQQIHPDEENFINQQYFRYEKARVENDNNYDQQETEDLSVPRVPNERFNPRFSTTVGFRGSIHKSRDDGRYRLGDHYPDRHRYDDDFLDDNEDSYSRINRNNRSDFVQGNPQFNQQQQPRHQFERQRHKRSFDKRSDRFRSLRQNDMDGGSEITEAVPNRQSWGRPVQVYDTVRQVTPVFPAPESVKDTADTGFEAEFQREDQIEYRVHRHKGSGASGELSEQGRAQTAFDFIRDVNADRQEAEMKAIAEKDKDGSLMALYRIWSKIPFVNSMSRPDLVDLVASRVLHQENDLLAISKPYGLASQSGPKLKTSLSDILRYLRPVIAPDAEKLYACQRLDKETTGVLMLATTRDKKEEIASLMAEKKIYKKYLCVTRGIPELDEGVIDIPLGYGKAGGRFKMFPMTDSKKLEESRDGREAVTEYRILDKSPFGCALVECTMRTGVRHQIRAHMGFGMNTPVIGDHKYSEYLAFKPQRLSGDILRALGIRSQKSRHLPMLLHARQVVIPNYLDGKNLMFTAPLPKCFAYILRKLKLKF